VRTYETRPSAFSCETLSGVVAGVEGCAAINANNENKSNALI